MIKLYRKTFVEVNLDNLSYNVKNIINTYIKSMKDKNALIASLEKEIQDIKKHNIQGSMANQPLLGNVIKKISGGIK